MLPSFSINLYEACARHLALSLVTGLLFLCSCDTQTELFGASDTHHFSLYGTLDVAADTQVIRIDPLRYSSQTEIPAELAETVVLENVGTGTEVILRDSLTTVDTGPVRAHNFWTTHPIEPGTSYRVSVRREGEPLTTATTTTPERGPNLTLLSGLLLPCLFPTPVYGSRRSENTFVVTVENVEHVAAADMIYPLTTTTEKDTLRSRIVSSHYDSIERTGNAFEISVFYREELADFHPDPPDGSPECPTRDHFTYSFVLMAVTAGGPDWPEWRNAPIEQVTRPDSFSNVEGGHGFVGGTYSDTIRVPLLDRIP